MNQEPINKYIIRVVPKDTWELRFPLITGIAWRKIADETVDRVTKTVTMQYERIIYDEDGSIFKLKYIGED